MNPLTFLNSGALLALGAVVLPFLIHLLARRKPVKVVFSSLRFLQKVQRQENRRIKLINLLIIILRTLVVLFFFLALARPALKNTHFSGDGHSPTAVAIIIDNSCSMDFYADTSSDLDKAITRAAEINKLLTPRDQVTVFTLDESWNRLHAYLNQGPLPEAEFTSPGLCYVPLKQEEILARAAEKLADSGLLNREIYFITDNQYEEVTKLPAIPVYYLPVGEYSKKPGFACKNAVLEIDPITREAGVTFTVQSCGQLAGDAICRLVLNGAVQGETAVAVPAGGNVSGHFILPAGGGDLSGWVEVRDDIQPFDNRASFSGQLPQNPVLAAISGKDGLSAPLASLTSIYVTDKGHVLQFAGQSPASQQLNNCTNVLAVDVNNMSVQAAQVLDQTSHTVFIATSRADKTWQQYLARRFNLQWGDWQTRQLPVDPLPTADKAIHILPKQALLYATGFWQAKNTGSTVLISAQGEPLLLEKDGSYLFMGDFDSFMSDYGVDYKPFPAIIWRLLELTANTGAIEPAVTVGTPVLTTQSSFTDPQGVVMPVGFGRFIPRQPGLYKGAQNNYTLGVDPISTESDFTPATTDKLPKGVTLCGQNWRQQIFAGGYGTELWKPLFIVVLLLMLAEMLVVLWSNNRNRMEGQE